MHRKWAQKCAWLIAVCLAAVASGCAPQPRPTLRVCTLNVAHGRGLAAIPGLNLVVSGEACKRNLKTIADALRRERPDVVALQEADGPSSWSGRFDHVEFLAEAAGYPHRQHGLHVKVERDPLSLRYGTALLARGPLVNSESHEFRAEPLDSKGYVLAEVEFDGRPLVVVSVHLDFKTARTRGKQARALIDRLKNCPAPLVVMGDFNSDCRKPENAVCLIAEQLDLQAYKPMDGTLPTHPAWDRRRRLDWILISSELEFRRHRTLPDRLSDHLPVVAELAWRPGYRRRTCLPAAPL